MTLFAVDLAFVGFHVALKLGLLVDPRFALTASDGFADVVLDFQLLATAVAAAGTWSISRQPTHGLWAGVFAFLALDHRLRLHEWLGLGAAEITHRESMATAHLIEAALLLAVALVVLVVAWRLYPGSDDLARSTTWLMLLILAGFAIFGVLVEAIYALLSGSVPRVVTGGLGVLEDGGEMALASIALAYAVAILRQVFRGRAGAEANG